MGEAVTGAIQKHLSSHTSGIESELLPKTQPGKSFENTLKGGDGQAAQNQNAAQPPARQDITNDKKLDGMRLDLIDRYNSLPFGVPKTTAILPEFLDTKTRMSSFRDILNSAVGSVTKSPQGTDLQGRFSTVEKEWFQLENFMKSDKELSQGELLGLQARLYQISQHIDVLSKVVDQMTGGVKTVLNTNV